LQAPNGDIDNVVDPCLQYWKNSNLEVMLVSVVHDVDNVILMYTKKIIAKEIQHFGFGEVEEKCLV
jgi:hypothetical protein